MTNRQRKSLLKHSTLALGIALVGCQSNRCDDCSPSSEFGWCRDIPRGAIPQPLGTSVCQWQTAHTELADRESFLMYDTEWQPGTATLTTYGTEHLARIVGRFPHSSHAILLQPDANAELNEARRQVVLDALSAADVKNIGDRIQFGTSIAEGLRGIEAPRSIPNNRLPSSNN